MVTESAVESVPSLEEQELLDDEVKIRWDEETKSRSRFQERVVGALVSDAHGNRGDDGGEPELRGVMQRAFTRQRTQVVFKTKEEAVEFLKFSKHEGDPSQFISVTGTMAKTYRRVRRELREALDEQGVVIDDVEGV